MKLGRKPQKHDRRTLKLDSYLPVMPPVPTAVDWSGKVPCWGMMANDTVGDCTVASAGHLEMLWTSQASVEYPPTDASILAAYSAITGFNPADPSTDQGAAMVDVLNYWRNAGISGHRINSYINANPQNTDQVKASIALFGGLYAGVMLPQSAIDAAQSGTIWSDVTDNNILGGHAFPVVAYDTNGLTCITWGKKQGMTWAWLAKYMDECYAVLSSDWFKPGGIAPSGFNMPQLQIDLSKI